jgi:hypothetical protein
MGGQGVEKLPADVVDHIETDQRREREGQGNGYRVDVEGEAVVGGDFGCTDARGHKSSCDAVQILREDLGLGKQKTHAALY